MSIKPNWYKKKIKKSNYKNLNEKIIKREGHHPNCLQFRNHVIKVKNKKYCAGCLGLSIGSFLSIILIIIYNLINIVYFDMYWYLLMFGLIIILYSFFEMFLNNKYPWIHLLSNTILIIGFLLILIGTIEKTGEFFYGLISLLVSFLFLKTRIQLSIFNHENICLNCNRTCKIY
jgi:hypothetical protein